MRFSDAQIAVAILDLTEKHRGDAKRVVTGTIDFLKRWRLLRRSRHIVEALERAIREKNASIAVTVVTARELGSSEQSQMQERMRALFPGRKAECVFRVQPDLIGGLSIETQEARYDASLKRSLQLLAQSF